MKKLVFSGNGFPIYIKSLQYLQENTILSIKSFLGNNENYSVLWGMNINSLGTVISEGVFCFNGELIPFIESSIPTPNPTITINESIENANFNTNPTNISYTESLPAYSSKVAQIGINGNHTFPLSRLIRVPKIKVFSLSELNMGQSSSYKEFDITADVDLDIIKRTLTWDMSFIRPVNGLNMITSIKNVAESSGDPGFIKNPQLYYNNSSCFIKGLFSFPNIEGAKLIVNYV